MAAFRTQVKHHASVRHEKVISNSTQLASITEIFWKTYGQRNITAVKCFVLCSSNSVIYPVLTSTKYLSQADKNNVEIIIHYLEITSEVDRYTIHKHWPHWSIIKSNVSASLELLVFIYQKARLAHTLSHSFSCDPHIHLIVINRPTCSYTLYTHVSEYTKCSLFSV